jgi:hypothetical protein
MRMYQPTAGPRPPARTLAGACLLLGAIAACGDGPSTAEPRLTGGAPTLEELGSGVWNGIVARDAAALERLRLTEFEHNQLVWPEQSAAQEPSAAANLDFWWQNIQLRNRAALDDLFAVYGGATLALRDVECIGDPQAYESFTALTDCRLTLDGPTGPFRVEAFRYVVRMGGAHKVLRYYGDE